MQGRIAVDKVMLTVALLVVPFLIFVGYMAAGQGATLIGGTLIIGTLVCFIGLLPALTPALDVVWDKQGVAGPCQVWGPFFGLKRTRIGWDEIVRLGGTAFNYAWLEAADGRRIYWTEQYRDHPRFFAAVKRRRPDLLTARE